MSNETMELLKVHQINLHDWGVAQGLEVSGTGSQLTVHPGVGVDRAGQLLALAAAVQLPTGILGGQTVYVTLRLAGTPPTPTPQLQSRAEIDGDNGDFLVLALAEINQNGEVTGFKTEDDKYRRRMVGGRLEGLAIQRSEVVGGQVQAVTSAKIGSGVGGGLRITVPQSGEGMVLAQEAGGNFASLDVQADIASLSGALSVAGVANLSGVLTVTGAATLNNSLSVTGATRLGDTLTVTGAAMLNNSLTVTGGVGIGTTDPGRWPLAVRARGISEELISFQSPSGQTKWHINQNLGGTRPGLNFVETGVADGRLFIQAGGNVGIGTTSPAAKLDVSGGAVNINNRGAGAVLLTLATERSWQLRQLGTGAGTALELASVGGGGNKNFVINTTGTVGIGTTGPDRTFRLDVAGVAHASSYDTSSDARFKTKVTPLTGVLEKLEKIQSISFEWNEVYEALGRSTGQREIGVIAQEVEAVFPELVTTWGDEDYRAVEYGRLAAVLIEAVKEVRAEQAAQIAVLKERLAVLEQTVTRQGSQTQPPHNSGLITEVL